MADTVQEAVFYLGLFFVASYDPLLLDAWQGFLHLADSPGDAEGNCRPKCAVGNCQGRTALLAAVELVAGVDQSLHIAMHPSQVKHQDRTGNAELRASLHSVFLAEALGRAPDVVFLASHHLVSFVDALIAAGNHVVSDPSRRFVFLAYALLVVVYHVASGPLCRWFFDALAQLVVVSLVAPGVPRQPVSLAEAKSVPAEHSFHRFGEDTALVHLHRAALVPEQARLVQAPRHEDTEVGDGEDEDKGEGDKDGDGGLYSVFQLPWRI